MDRHTLFSMQAGLFLFLGGVILLAFRTQRRQRNDSGGDWFAAAFFCGGVGLALQAERDVIPAVFSILMGNGLFLLFGVFTNRAIAQTTGQGRGQFISLLALDAATVANFAYFTYVQPNMALRVAEAVFVMAVFYLTIIALVLRSKDRVIQPAMRAIAVLLLIHTVGIVLWISLARRLRLADGWFSWIGIVSIAGLALSFLWMEHLRLQDRLEQSAMTDPLTGLLNRRGLDQTAARELHRAVREQCPCSALMMDMDEFKRINDSMGHAAGDASLRAVALVLRKTLRGSNVASRLGGDEFFVLLPDADETTVAMVAERIRSAVRSLRLKTPGGEHFGISISVGVVTVRGAQRTLANLLHDSDIVLYLEKRRFREQRESLDGMRASPQGMRESSIPGGAPKSLERSIQEAMQGGGSGGAHVQPSEAYSGSRGLGRA